jgi:SAM-dependent methyltransferase
MITVENARRDNAAGLRDTTVDGRWTGRPGNIADDGSAIWGDVDGPGRSALILSPVPERLSPRLAAIVNALPLQPHSRVLEIGCGPGAAARAVAARLTTGHILAVDRSAAAIAQAEAAAADEITSGRMSVRQVAAEDFVLQACEEPYDIVFAVRVGALDGRHPQAGQRVLRRIAMATTADARLFIDGGEPLRELPIPR